MKLSDIMGHAGLSVWAEIALVIFALAFAAVVVHTFAKKRRATFEEVSRMPLDDLLVRHERTGGQNPGGPNDGGQNPGGGRMNADSALVPVEGSGR